MKAFRGHDKDDRSALGFGVDRQQGQKGGDAVLVVFPDADDDRRAGSRLERTRIDDGLDRWRHPFRGAEKWDNLAVYELRQCPVGWVDGAHLAHRREAGRDPQGRERQEGTAGVAQCEFQVEGRRRIAIRQPRMGDEAMPVVAVAEGAREGGVVSKASVTSVRSSRLQLSSSRASPL